MNAQLLALLTDLRDSRVLRLYGDAYVPRIEAAIAALAAAKEAGDGELLAIADEIRRQVLHGATVDWRANMGEIAEQIHRLAAPSKEAGAPDRERNRPSQEWYRARIMESGDALDMIGPQPECPFCASRDLGEDMVATKQLRCRSCGVLVEEAAKHVALANPPGDQRQEGE